jgi:alanine dehydrogenase
VVIGGGVVGTHAARIAVGMGADVTVLDRSLPRMRYLDDVFRGVQDALSPAPTRGSWWPRPTW